MRLQEDVIRKGDIRFLFPSLLIVDRELPELSLFRPLDHLLKVILRRLSDSQFQFTFLELWPKGEGVLLGGEWGKGVHVEDVQGLASEQVNRSTGR